MYNTCHKNAQYIPLVIGTDDIAMAFLSQSTKWTEKAPRPKKTASRSRKRKDTGTDDEQSLDEIQDFTPDDRLSSDDDEIEEVTPPVKSSSRKHDKQTRKSKGDAEGSERAGKRKKAQADVEDRDVDHPTKRVQATSKSDRSRRAPINDERHTH